MKPKVGSVWEHVGNEKIIPSGVLVEVVLVSGEKLAAISHKREPISEVKTVNSSTFLAEFRLKRGLTIGSWLQTYWKIFAFVYATAIVIATVAQAALAFYTI